MTNGEALRQMPDEGLALFLAVRVNCFNCPISLGDECDHNADIIVCAEKIRKWLGQEENARK